MADGCKARTPFFHSSFSLSSIIINMRILVRVCNHVRAQKRGCNVSGMRYKKHETQFLPWKVHTYSNSNNSNNIYCHVPDTVLSTLYPSAHLTFTTIRKRRSYYYPHFYALENWSSGRWSHLPEVTDIVREQCWHLNLDLSPSVNDLLTEIKEICYCGKIKNCIIILLKKSSYTYTSLEKKGNDSLKIGFINTFDDWLSCFCNTQQFRKCLSEDIFIPFGYKWKYLSKRLVYKFS